MEYDETLDLQHVLETCYGQLTPSWIDAMKGFSSANMYRQRVIFFLQYYDRRKLEFSSIEAALVQYFYDSRNTPKVVGKPESKYCGTTLRGWFSIFLKFWKFTGKGNLRASCSCIEDNIGKWEKTESVRTALVFDEQNLFDAYNLNDTNESCYWKCFLSVSRCFAGRPSETFDLVFESFEYCTNQGSGLPMFIVNHIRKKTVGTVKPHNQFITGELEVKSVFAYVNRFAAADRKGNFWRKIDSVTGRGTNQNIGHNTVSNVYKIVARALNLDNPERYTGQCARRSTATLMASKGATLSLIKSVTGHKSDTVVQHYINESDRNKFIASEMNAVKAPKFARVSANEGSLTHLPRLPPTMVEANQPAASGSSETAVLPVATRQIPGDQHASDNYIQMMTNVSARVTPLGGPTYNFAGAVFNGPVHFVNSADYKIAESVGSAAPP